MLRRIVKYVIVQGVKRKIFKKISHRVVEKLRSR